MPSPTSPLPTPGWATGRTWWSRFWASWCPFCTTELPDFAAAQDEFGDTIKIIAIARRESLKKAKKFSDDLGVSDRLIMLLDDKDTFYTTIGGFTMPETIFVDEKGRIKDHKRGFMDLKEVRERIQNAFNL